MGDKAKVWTVAGDTVRHGDVGAVHIEPDGTLRVSGRDRVAREATSSKYVATYAPGQWVRVEWREDVS